MEDIGAAESQLLSVSMVVPTAETTDEAEPDAASEDAIEQTDGTIVQNVENVQDSLNEARDAIHDRDILGALEILNGTQSLLS